MFVSSDRGHCRGVGVAVRGDLFDLGYLPAVLPALRRIVSSMYLIPLPLYGSGGRKLRIFAVAAPSAWRSMPERISRFLSTLAEMPSGSWYSIGCENPSERTILGPLISAL